jgi:hypothetical protein
MGEMPCQPVWALYQTFFKDAETYSPERRDFNGGMEREGFRVVQGPARGTGKKPIKRDKALPEGLRRGTNRKNQQILMGSCWYGACVLCLDCIFLCVLLLNYEQFFYRPTNQQLICLYFYIFLYYNSCYAKARFRVLIQSSLNEAFAVFIEAM